MDMANEDQMLPQIPGASENSSLGALSQLMAQRQKMSEDLQGQYKIAQGQRDTARSAMDDAYEQAMAVLKKPVDDNTWLQMALAAARPEMPGQSWLLNAADAANTEQKRVRDLTQQNAMAASQLGINMQSAKMKEAQDLSDKLLAATTKLSSGSGGAVGGVGKIVTRPMDDGSILILNNVTGEQRIIPPTHAKQWAAAQAQGYRAALANEDPNPETYATNYANQVTAALSGMKPPVQGQPQGRPLSQGQQPVEASGAINIMPQFLPPEVQQEVERQIARMNANPADQTLRANTLARLRQIATQYPQAKPTQEQMQQDFGAFQQSQPETQPFKYLDKRQKEEEKAYGGAEGKGLYEEYKNLGAAHSASARMQSQLGVLETLYKTPGMPEGELGQKLQAVRSGLKSLGIDVDKEVGAADMANAVASNFALHLRTGEGTNLLPGAMSNYEDQLLQKMAPGLSLTNEGRVALIDYMREMNKTNMRIAMEAQKMAAEHNNMLPNTWPQRKVRIEKEEMARLTEKFRELSARFLKGAQ